MDQREQGGGQWPVRSLRISLRLNAPGADLGVQVRQAARPELAAKAGTGQLRVLVASTYPLDQAAEAHRAGMAGHAPGKLVLIP